MLMQYTSETLQWISNMLHFDILEVWIVIDGKMRCAYAFANEKTSTDHPDLELGCFPSMGERSFSLMLCEKAKSSPLNYVWSNEEPSMLDDQGKKITIWPTVFGIPIETEMSYCIRGPTQESDIFIIGMALNANKCSDKSIDFLLNLDQIFRVVLFQFDQGLNDIPPVEFEKEAGEYELDRTEFYPRTARSSISTSDVQMIDSPVDEAPVMFSAIVQSTSFRSGSFGVILSQIPVINQIRTDMSINEIAKTTHYTNGSNSNIFLGSYNNERIIIKMLMESEVNSEVANLEFETEIDALSRINHPNILKIFGSGILPRRFILLEYLEGKTLYAIQSKNLKSKTRRAFSLFKSQETFTFPDVIIHAHHLASALNYLHSDFYPGASIIHRDLKPDNIGFTADHTLKLLDFGLSICVKKRESTRETYSMTGHTGSLRYMAPEVALSKPYTEKVDVYSFAVVVWQMARDRLPFHGMNKFDLNDLVHIGGQRLKLDKKWPPAFSDLLERCWHANHWERPSFAEVMTELQGLFGSRLKRASSSSLFF